MPLVDFPLDKGFAPDRDPYEPGVMSSCYGLEFVNGLWQTQRNPTASSTISSLAYASGSYFLDGAVTTTASGGEVWHGAYYDTAATKIKALARSTTVGAALTDVSIAGNYTVSTGEDNTVTFAQFGNLTLMAMLAHTVQIRDATGASAFANVSGTNCPKAKHVVVWGPPTSQRVMLLHYNDGTEYADGWWTSHKGGPQSAWTPDLGTDAANGRLFASGPIKAAIAYRDDIVAWGADSMWLGKYVGPPFIVEWQRIGNNVGCVGPHAAKVVGGTLYWMGKQGLFAFDGSAIRRMPWPVDLQLKDYHKTHGDVYGYRWIQLRERERGRKLVVSYRFRDTLGSAPVFTYSIDLESGLVGKLTDTTGTDADIYAYFDNGYAMTGTVHASAGALVLTKDAITPWYFATDYVDFTVAIGHSHIDTMLRGVTPEFIAFAPTLWFGQLSAHANRSVAASAYTQTTPTASASPWRGDCTMRANFIKINFKIQTAATAETDFRLGKLLLDMDGAGKR